MTVTKLAQSFAEEIMTVTGKEIHSAKGWMTVYKSENMLCRGNTLCLTPQDN